MSRRLLNRSRAPATSNASRSSSILTVETLPDYEPPCCPLSDSARKALGDLSNNRGIAAYESQLRDSVRYLGHSVGDLHERLRARKERLADLSQRRQDKGVSNKSAEEERLEAHVPDLEGEVDRLTRDSERALRQVIDRKAELEDEATILGDLFTNAATHTSPDDAGDGTTTGVLDALRGLRDEKMAGYIRLTPHERYALNNDYAGFKKLWHDAAVGEDGAPLQDASRWFLSNGEPDMSILPRGRDNDNSDEDEDDDDDDDVAIARENLSVNCPLTLLPMVEPYGNRKCPHVFEKSAILDYLGTTAESQCPQTGCSQTFSRARFEDDFYPDEAMRRRIQRVKQKEAHDSMDEDEEEEEEDHEGSFTMGVERPVKGRRLKREYSNERMG